MEINFVVVRVRKDNLMYLFYTDDIAFSIDAYEAKIIDYLLNLTLIHKNVYTINELFGLKSHTKKRQLLFSLTTHHHFDHSDGNRILQTLWPTIPIYTGTNIKDNEIISKNGIEILCIKTPCHTIDSVCYLINSKYLITGDFIFKIGCGRFFEGNSQMFINGLQKIFKLVNNDVLILYGHDYTESNLKFAITKINYNNKDIDLIKNNIFLTLRDEKRLNPFFQNLTPQVITTLRKEKDNFC